jgi:hypothetical protein
MTVASSVYESVIKWAFSQQQYEAANGHAAPITVAQRKALVDLHELITPRPPPAPLQEPEIGDTNWVGLLHRTFSWFRCTELFPAVGGL